MTVIIIALALWSLIPGFMARKKGRSFWGYYFLSLFISPLVTIIIVAFLSDITKEPELYSAPPPERFNTNNELEFCVNCGADVSKDAAVCHICGCNKKITPSGDNE